MAEISGATSVQLKPGEHRVFAADTRLQTAALRAGSANDIAALLANAENALGALRGEFEHWLQAESARLSPMLEDFMSEGTKAQKDVLYRTLHDIRSNAPAFGNPLAGQIADHMCKLFDASASVPSAIVEAHIRSIQAVVREKATTAEHPVGGVIIRELMHASAASQNLKATEQDT